MKMSESGSIEINGCHVRSTPYGWVITRKGVEIGTASTLDECEGVIESHRINARNRLAAITREHEARQQEERNT